MSKFIPNKLFQILLIVVIVPLIFVGCPKSPTENEIRFKPLNEPIEGTLLFVAGPTLEVLDTLQNNDPWDFYKLTGNTFTKLNDEPWFIYQGFPWNYQWSPQGRYFSFYHDKDNEPINTDDIVIIDINTMNEIYLTDSVGDANTFDEAVYHWAEDDSYIYFTAIPLGESEYNPEISPDIYRVKPDGSEIEQITDNEYFEAHAIPTPDGNNIFYGIFSPDSLTGFYLYDLNTNTTKRIVSKEQFENKFGATGHPTIFGHKLTIDMHPSGEYVIIYPNIKIDIKSDIMETIDYVNQPDYIYKLIFIPKKKDIAILYEGDWYGDNIYTINLNTGITNNLTGNLTTLDGKKCRFGIPTVSPNGEYIAFTAQLDFESSDWLDGDYDFEEFIADQKTDIYIMNLITKKVQRLTTGLLGWEGFLKWVQ